MLQFFLLQLTKNVATYKLRVLFNWTMFYPKPASLNLPRSLQFFKEANETYSNLQKEHEKVRKAFPCNRDTSLEDLLELLKALEVQ